MRNFPSAIWVLGTLMACSGPKDEGTGAFSATMGPGSAGTSALDPTNSIGNGGESVGSSAGASTGSGGAPGVSEATPVEPTPLPPLAPKPVAVCEIGKSEACACSSGGAGLRVCTSPDGVFSDCGCVSSSEPALYVPRPAPVVHQCGSMTCAPYPEEDTEVGAKHCCTAQVTCGSQASFIFGAACVERGGDPGVASPACPGETPDFLDLAGCCRPDGKCGLSIDRVNNWDVGCIERTEMAALLNAGSGDRDLLTALSFRAVKKAEFTAISCATK
ncbi:MAG: hypothetical protein SFV15_26860 [Polyangiaceae bacterium]|nr:hypothetical protein [Polyangiaceae bacterium]